MHQTEIVKCAEEIEKTEEIEKSGSIFWQTERSAYRQLKSSLMG